MLRSSSSRCIFQARLPAKCTGNYSKKWENKLKRKLMCFRKTIVVVQRPHSSVNETSVSTVVGISHSPKRWRKYYWVISVSNYLFLWSYILSRRSILENGLSVANPNVRGTSDVFVRTIHQCALPFCYFPPRFHNFFLLLRETDHK